MSRATDPSSSEALNGRRTPAVQPQVVCPFCGTVSETPGIACRQCGMENSQATRAATRSKIGPWFVWQARNPSAPGMSWATLLSLVERGRVTPRSVMRGPTTGQLWRFAARVKGVSREFGTCWHCGGEIHPAARLCPACKRLQQPPAQPDALLETDLFTPPPAPPAPAPPPPDFQAVRQEAAAIASAPHIPEDGQPLPLDPAPAPRLSREMLPIVDAGHDALPTGLEMRAFDLPDDYDTPVKRGGGVFRKIFAAAAVAILCGVAAGGYSPQFRDAVVRRYHAAVARFNGQSPAPTTPKLTPLPAPPADSVTAGHRQPPAATRPTSTPLMNVHTPAQVIVGPGTKKSSPATKPVVTPPPASTRETAVQIAPPAVDSKTAERWAWERRERASKYEQQQEYAQAQRDYEWILDLRLPEGVGPTDVQERLARVRTILQQQPQGPTQAR